MAPNRVREGMFWKNLLNFKKKFLFRTLTKKIPNPNSNILFNGNHSIGFPGRIPVFSMRNRDPKLRSKSEKIIPHGCFFIP